MPNLLLRDLHPFGPVPPEGNASLLLLQFGKTSKPSLTSPASPSPAPRPERQERVSRNPLSPWSKVESGKPRQGCAPFNLPAAPSLAPSPEQGCAALGSRCGWYLTPSHPHLTTWYVLCMQGHPPPALVFLSVALNFPSSDYLIDQRRQEIPVTHSIWGLKVMTSHFPT